MRWIGALALAAGFGYSAGAAAQSALCADPSTVCSAKVSAQCLEQRRLGAGSISVAGAAQPDCRTQLAEYTSCLTTAALECSQDQAATAPTAAPLCSTAFEKDLWVEVKAEEDCAAYAAFIEACPNSRRLGFVRYKMQKIACGENKGLSGLVKKAAVENETVVAEDGPEPDYNTLEPAPDDKPLAPERNAQKDLTCTEDAIDKMLAGEDRPTKIDIGLFLDAAAADFRIFTKPGAHFEGVEAIIDYWNDRPDLKDLRWLAYILATAYYETGGRLVPVREGFARSDEDAVRKLTRFAKSRGGSFEKTMMKYVAPDPVTGKSYFGRGYIQLTWDYNYKKVDQWYRIKARSESVYWNPDRLLDPKFSSKLLVDAMVYGWYTGSRHCLARYFPADQKADWRNARRAVNGVDRATTIANVARQFQKVIEAAQAPATGPIRKN